MHAETMTQRVVARAVAALLLISPALADAARVTVDDLMKLRSLLDVRISPDGRRVAYVVSTPSIDRAVHEAAVYVVPTAGGEPVRFTYGTNIFNRPLPAARLRWSPDGTRLSFIASIDGAPQVVAMSADGGEPAPLTSIAGGVTTYEWAPDSRSIAFLAPDPVPADEEQRQREKTFVIEVDRHPRGARVWVQPVGGTGTAKAITPTDQFVSDLQWSPDGRTIVYSASGRVGFTAQYHTRVYTIAVTGGAPQAIVDRPGMNRTPQFSPDGAWIAFVSTGPAGGMIATEDLFVVSADGSASTMRNLTEASEAWVGEFVWAPDSRSILYIPVAQLPDSGSRIFEQPIYRVVIDSGRRELITPDKTVNYSLTLANGWLAYKSVKPRDMGEVHVLRLSDRTDRAITEINPELRHLDLGSLEAIHWPSRDGQEIWGLLLTPPGYTGGTRIPLVVYCHGGPIGGYTYGLFPQFMHTVAQVDPYPAEAMASAGMAVFFPMPRGGSGYGLAGFRAIVNRWGEVDYEDIMTGVDALVARGVADPNRLGVMGASYGGYMTDWIVTQTSRFKAASTGASISDLAQLYYLSDGGDVMLEYFGTPWEHAAAYAAHSPITHASKVTTPLLIQHGENDRRVPIGQAQAFYRALKALGKTVELEIYPRGGHVNYEPPLEREYMRRNLEWFQRWLQ